MWTQGIQLDYLDLWDAKNVPLMEQKILGKLGPLKEHKSLGKLVVHMIEQVYPVVPSVVVEPVCPMVSISIAVATYSLMAWIQVDKMTSVVDSRVYTQVVFVANCIDPALKGVFSIVQAMSEDVRTIQEVPVYYSERNLVR